MKIFQDKKIIILISILTIFTISYFIIANKISYAFLQDYNIEDSYNQTMEVIKECAIAYGEKNPDLFKEDDITYIKVQDLIDNNYIATNEDGNISNPLKESETLNSNVIKLKKTNDEITAEIDS